MAQQDSAIQVTQAVEALEQFKAALAAWQATGESSARERVKRLQSPARQAVNMAGVTRLVDLKPAYGPFGPRDLDPMANVFLDMPDKQGKSMAQHALERVDEALARLQSHGQREQAPEVLREHVATTATPPTAGPIYNITISGSNIGGLGVGPGAIVSGTINYGIAAGAPGIAGTTMPSPVTVSPMAIAAYDDIRRLVDDLVQFWRLVYRNSVPDRFPASTEELLSYGTLKKIEYHLNLDARAPTVPSTTWWDAFPLHATSLANAAERILQRYAGALDGEAYSLIHRLLTGYLDSKGWAFLIDAVKTAGDRSHIPRPHILNQYPVPTDDDLKVIRDLHSWCEKTYASFSATGAKGLQQVAPGPKGEQGLTQPPSMISPAARSAQIQAWERWQETRRQHLARGSPADQTTRGSGATEMPILESVYLSYGDDDLPTARRLFESLEIAGVPVFFRAEHAVPGAHRHRSAKKSIREYEHVILLCSERSLSAPSVMSELDEMLSREFDDGASERIIPVLFDKYAFDGWAPRHPDIRRAVLDRVPLDMKGAEGDRAKFEKAMKRLLGALKG